MKYIYRISIAILMVVLTGNLVSAQRIGDLKGINFQAVAIDENGKEIVGMDINGKPLFDKTIGVRFSILKGSSGTVEYQETQTANTDKYGLFSLVIGEGTITGQGQYTKLMDIPWIDADQFLKVEIATKNDGNYKLVSNQQFMSVPYSFYTNDIADNAITTAKIRDSTILNQDIHTGAIDSRTILDSTILNQDIANNTIDLTAKVANSLPVFHGGTGDTTLTSGSLLVGNGTGAVQSLGQATNGQIPIGVTGGKPILANLTAGTGIIVTNTAGGIQIASGVQGVNSAAAGNVQVNTILAGSTFISPAIPLSGIAPGNIVVGSCDQDLKGCMMTTYVTGNNIIKVAIFNGTGGNVNLGTVALRVLVVQ